MYQPYPSSGHLAGPLRLPAPAPVLTAVKLMYAGVAITTVYLIILLALIGVDGAKAVRGSAHPGLTITLAIALLMVMIALWWWMARANGQGQNWARILSTVLFGLATLNLTSAFKTPGIRLGFWGPGVGAIFPVLTWLVGLAAVWLLWRQASSAFFKPQGFTDAGPGA